MKAIKLLFVMCFIVTYFTSCKKIAKSFTKEVASETTEKATKQVGEEVVYGVGEKAIRKMDVDELIEFIRKNKNNSLANSFEKLDKSAQKRIKKAIDEDVNFFNYLMCSNTLLDDFGSLVKNAPKASKDINILKMYAKSTFDARRYGKKNMFKDIFIKEADGYTIFVNKAEGTELARIRDGIVDLSSQQGESAKIIKDNIFDSDLLPNCAYKVKGNNGASFVFNIDNYGRIQNMKFSGNPEDIGDLFKDNQNIYLGKEWSDFVKGKPKGNYTISFNYYNKDVAPNSIGIKSKGKAIKQKKNFRNALKSNESFFSHIDNGKLIERYVNSLGLDSKQSAELIEAMNADNGLSVLIHQNPEKNIQRWLNTKKAIDKSKIKVTPKGEFPRNAENYAGNVYYFNPHLNEGLMSRLKNGGDLVNLRGMDGLSYEDLMMLDKLYPDGVPFTKEGFPDFSKVAFKGKNGKTMPIDVGSIGESTKDIGKANKKFKELGYEDDGGYTWHHIEGTTSLMRVPFVIHALVDHTGGISMAK